MSAYPKKSNSDHILVIPYKKLSPSTLRSLIEEVVTRDGTDYGEIEEPLERKISQVYKELESGRALILFDKVTETCNILAKDDPRLKKSHI